MIRIHTSWKRPVRQLYPQVWCLTRGWESHRLLSRHLGADCYARTEKPHDFPCGTFHVSSHVVTCSLTNGSYDHTNSCGFGTLYVKFLGGTVIMLLFCWPLYYWLYTLFSHDGNHVTYCMSVRMYGTVHYWNKGFLSHVCWLEEYSPGIMGYVFSLPFKKKTE